MIKILKTRLLGIALKRTSIFGGVLLFTVMACNTVFAYETYTAGCIDCHDDFDGPVTFKGTVFPSDSKHEMHRASKAMGTDCGLCHDSNGDDPALANCAGCHIGAGLRAHHAANSVTTCYTVDCHDSSEPLPAETDTPPYYGTAGTQADNPCNDVLAANVNENWTIGDFIGLDNDGDNIYDLADFDCGPYQIVDIEAFGNDIQISWETAGGRKDILQAAPSLTNTFVDVGSVLTIPGVGVVTTNVVETGGAAGANRFYRIRYAP